MQQSPKLQSYYKTKKKKTIKHALNIKRKVLIDELLLQIQK